MLHTIKCGKWTSRVIIANGAQSLAELNQAERSEAQPREARPPPKAAGAEGAPELREGRQAKLGCDSTAATQLPRINCLRSAGMRALHELDLI